MSQVARVTHGRYLVTYTRSCAGPQIRQSTGIRSGLFGGHRSAEMILVLTAYAAAELSRERSARMRCPVEDLKQLFKAV